MTEEKNVIILRGLTASAEEDAATDERTKAISARLSELRSKPSRTSEELRPVAQALAENADIMWRFRSVAGSEDKERGLQMISEITKEAQALDPTITGVEGTWIVVELMSMIGPPWDGSQLPTNSSS